MIWRESYRSLLITQLLVSGFDLNQVTTQTTSEIFYSNSPTTQAGKCFIRLNSCICPESSEMIPFLFRNRKGDEQAHSLQALKGQAQGCKPANQTSADSSPLITHLQLGQHQYRCRVTSPAAPPTRSDLCDPHTARERLCPSIVLHAIGQSWPRYSEATNRSAGSERREASVTKAAVSAGRQQRGRQSHGSGRSLAARLAHFSFFPTFHRFLGLF